MAPDMKSVWSGAFLCGPAVTCLGADWRIRSMAAAGTFTGATGHEPATSGVTGRYGSTGYSRV
jgi:hypothetical protein